MTFSHCLFLGQIQNEYRPVRAGYERLKATPAIQDKERAPY